MAEEQMSIPVDPQFIYGLRLDSLASEVVRRKQVQGLVKKGYAAVSKARKEAYATIAFLAVEVGLHELVGYHWDDDEKVLRRPGLIKEKVEVLEQEVRSAGHALELMEALSTSLEYKGNADFDPDEMLEDKQSLANNYREMARQVRANPEAMALAYEQQAQTWEKSGEVE